MSNAASTDTKTQLLDVAEKMFAERGFASTTLRSVVNEAGANLAAVHYHFGSKEELLRAVVARISQPVVKQQLRRLSELEGQSESPSVEAILTAFLAPCLEFIVQDEGSRMVRAQFMGRCRTEPEPIQSIANSEFGAIEEASLDALQRALPEQSRSRLRWKLDLVVAALVRVQTEAGKPNALLQSSAPKDVQQTISQLVNFMAAGMRE
ncbi:TetR family transcriptional regulator [Romeria aff. gracilis LEGE 07310]|uniref:TetR family transcriptional regulator n=1 Tax=Vasconcelosia minhoensis LEGE 07310 TaxID=915328 RepID=A0A8J7DM63_9CYAN|nr:TetR/AcrR family transcriptional regulator [Romeria gracilis]MBE9075995.1 TetR family transcriptional regulator [Romeria aff. gracilis LEGE 07310]